MSQGKFLLKVIILFMILFAGMYYKGVNEGSIAKIKNDKTEIVVKKLILTTDNQTNSAYF